MVRYRRNFVAGGTFFFTATLVDRSSRALIDHIEALRVATRDTRRSHPFAIDAIVVLPDHLHVVMTLPEGDADYPNRWRLIKRRFTDAVVSLVTPDFAALIRAACWGGDFIQDQGNFGEPRW
jgi:putative transposase